MIIDKTRVGLLVVVIVTGMLLGCQEEADLEKDNAPAGCTTALKGDVYLATNFPSLHWPVREHFDKAVLLAASEVNEGGGIGSPGLTLGVISCDTLGDREIGVENVLGLGALPEVAAIVGAARSAVTMGDSPSNFGTCLAGADNGIVSITPGSTNDNIGNIVDDDYCYRTCAADSIQGNVQAGVAAAMGCTSVLYISDGDDSYTTGLMGNFEDAASEALVVEGKAYRTGGELATSVLEDLGAGTYDCLGSSLFAKDFAPIVNALAADGAFDALRLLVGDGAHSAGFLADLTPGALTFVEDGTLLGTKPGCTDATATFKERYLSHYGEEDQEFDHSAYDAAIVLATAMSMLEDPKDRTGIRDLLRDGKLQTGERINFENWSVLRDAAIAAGTVDYEGAAGPHDFEANGDVDGNIWVGEVRDGKFVGSTTYKSCWSSSGVPLP